MITVDQIHNGSGYMTNHLSANDYYSEAETLVGYWHGNAVEKLGLKGKVVTEKVFEALRTNRHPLTREKLTPRRPKVALHDFVVSAPKSTSIAAMIGGDDRIIEAFNRCVEKAFDRLERYAAVRFRKGEAVKTEEIRRTGNGVAALFRHDTSRLLDPQLHTHLVHANMSWHEESGRWLALQPIEMAEQSKAWIRGEFYREFAQECRDLGYATEQDREAFRLTGIDPSIEKSYSQRTLQRERFEERYKKLFEQDPSKKRIEQFIKDHKAAATRRFTDEYESAFGKKPSKEDVSEFVQDWRSSKMIKATRQEVEAIQRDRITPEQMKEVKSLVDKAQNITGEKRLKIVAEESVQNVSQSSAQIHEQADQTQMPKEMWEDWQQSFQRQPGVQSVRDLEGAWVGDQMQLKMPQHQWEDWQQSLRRGDERREKNDNRWQQTLKRKQDIQRMRRIRKAIRIAAALKGNPEKVMGYKLQQLARQKHGTQRRIYK